MALALTIGILALLVVPLQGEECMTQAQIDGQAGPWGSWIDIGDLSRHTNMPEKTTTPWQFTGAELESARRLLNKGPDEELSRFDLQDAIDASRRHYRYRRQNPKDYRNREISTELFKVAVDSTNGVRADIHAFVLFPCTGSHQCDESQKQQLLTCHVKAYNRVKTVLAHLTGKRWADLDAPHQGLINWYFSASTEGVFPGGRGEVQELDSVMDGESKEEKILASVRHQLMFVVQGLVGGDYELDVGVNSQIYGFRMRGRTYYNCEHWPFSMRKCTWINPANGAWSVLMRESTEDAADDGKVLTWCSRVFASSRMAYPFSGGAHTACSIVLHELFHYWGDNVRDVSTGGGRMSSYFSHKTNQKGLHNADSLALYTMYAYRRLRPARDLEEEEEEMVAPETSVAGIAKLARARNRHQRALQPMDLEQKSKRVEELLEHAQNLEEDEEGDACQLNLSCESCLLTPGCDFQSTTENTWECAVTPAAKGDLSSLSRAGILWGVANPAKASSTDTEFNQGLVKFLALLDSEDDGALEKIEPQWIDAYMSAVHQVCGSKEIPTNIPDFDIPELAKLVEAKDD